MPFTPYHFGPSGFLGLVFRRWVDLPMFLLGNVIVDVAVLFASGLPHRHWHFHSLLVGGLVGAICGAAVYLARPVREFFEWGMGVLHIRYRAGLVKMIVGGLAGVWLHVLIDSFYHWDVQPFWPMEGNPLYRLVHGAELRVSEGQIKMICLAFLVPAGILYAMAVWSFYRSKKIDAANS